MATYLIEFYDEQGEEICRFNNDDSNFYEREEQEIAEGRGIIGVYGFLHQKPATGFIANFGFITVTYPEEKYG